ncbi:MAG: glycoside hydrolase domain-containing protein, partial [Myxococcota bacterium]
PTSQLAAQTADELQITLEGARDSYVSAQVVVTATGGPLSAVQVELSPLTSAAGDEIAIDHIEFFRQAYIDFRDVGAMGGTRPVPDNSATGDGRIPDPLIPLDDPYDGSDELSSFSVRGDENQPLWMDIYIPRGTPAGTYQGAVRLSAEGGVAEIPVTVTVWDLVLPGMNTVTTHFRMTVNDFIEYHGGVSDCSGDYCWFDTSTERGRALLNRYEELAHRHRIDVGQHRVPELSTSCSPPDSWEAYDNAVRPYMDGDYFADGVPSPRLETPFRPGAEWGLEGDCTRAEYTAFAAEYAQHLKDRGWFDRAVVYAYDEPPADKLPDIAEHANWMIDGDPDWKDRIMITTTAKASTFDLLGPVTGIFATAPAEFDTWYELDSDHFGRDEWTGLRADGIDLWFYESNNQGAPYASFATNTLDANEPAMMMWGSWFERATGFLYYDVTGWDESEPWGPTTEFGKTGDGVLIYPGHHDGSAGNGSPDDVTIDGPVPSLRLKSVRAGLQDWALFKLAEQRGLGAYAREQVSQAYRLLGGCGWDGCIEPEDGFYWRSENSLMNDICHSRSTICLSNGIFQRLI